MAVTQRISATSILAPIVLAAIAPALPRFGVSSYVQILIYYTAYYLTLGQAWNLMSGMTGYVSFAHGALAGIGAYATVMSLNAGWPLIPSLLAGPATALIASLVIGATSLRLRGLVATASAGGATAATGCAVAGASGVSAGRRTTTSRAST